MGKKPVTYEDLEALPPNMVGEIVEGELYASPRPASLHRVAASQLLIELGGPFNRGKGGPGGWWLFTEPELHLGGDVLVPDVGGWRRERLRRALRVGAYTLAPDWVCEVLSPSTKALDRKVKLLAYARAGVRHAWLVDPSARTLEVFRLEGDRYSLVGAHGGTACVYAEPFQDFELELAVLWGDR